MRPLSQATARIAGKSFERKYIALGRIVNAWSEIVGPDLAHKAQPVKIHYRKPDKLKGSKSRIETKLDIAVSSADATLLHYQKDLIIERINHIFGECWITAIRFVNIPANEAPSYTTRKQPKPLTREEKNTLSTLLLAIEDVDIKERLENLGKAVIGKENS